MTITHGIASGDVTASSAVIWARASGLGQMHVEYDTSPEFAQPKSSPTGVAGEGSDYTVHVKLEGLKPDTLYHYRVWFTSDGGEGSTIVSESKGGTFRTAPEASVSREVSFVWGGDLGGLRYCRRVGQGYDIFSKMLELSPDFFVANGDMIYADNLCRAAGPEEGWENIPGDFSGISSRRVDWTDVARVREIYLAHWRYNREDPHFQQFLRHTPMYSQWDDHEVINDFGASWEYWNVEKIDRAGYPNIVAAGREAFFNYSPIDRDPDDPNRVYRRFNWGNDLALWIVDARSYRSRNDLADTPENNKTLLGAEQLAWLKRGLLESDATWKVVSSDVPISVPTGSNTQVLGHDGWADGTDPSSQMGFERELLDLVNFLRDNGIRNVVFVTTDAHWAASIRYEIAADEDEIPLVFHEFISGPLSSSRLKPVELDPTLNPTTLYAEGGIFNFGYVRIRREADGLPHLIVDVRGEDGLPRPGSVIDLTPR